MLLGLFRIDFQIWKRGLREELEGFRIEGFLVKVFRQDVPNMDRLLKTF